MSTPDDRFGLIANVEGVDRIFRMGAKVWLCSGTGGEGWFRFEWWGMSRGGRTLQKWAPTERFTNFRAAWVPPHLRERVSYFRPTRAEAETWAKNMQTFADALRAGSKSPFEDGYLKLSEAWP
ncbi:MAG: hypothetical protein E5W57_04100 [Mesorhizobium sp.]|nr:MAG: hypothetical protein E5W57_04100 [Mesorhizobium sp.]